MGRSPWHKALVFSVSWENGAVLSSGIPGNGCKPQAGRNRQVHSSSVAQSQPGTVPSGSILRLCGRMLRLLRGVPVPRGTDLHHGCHRVPWVLRLGSPGLRQDCAGGPACCWGGLVAAAPGGNGVGRGPGAGAECCGWSASHRPVSPHTALLPGERPPQGREPPKQDGAQGTAHGGMQVAPSSSSRGLQGAGGAPLAPRVLRRAGEEAVFALAAGLCLHTDTSAPGPGTEPAAKLFQR